MSNDSAKLDQILALLERIAAIIDPNPGYFRGLDGAWFNRKTGESQYSEQRRLQNQARALQNQADAPNPGHIQRSDGAWWEVFWP